MTVGPLLWTADFCVVIFLLYELFCSYY